MNEADIENQALTWFADLGYETAHGDSIAPGGVSQERSSWSDVILWDRFHQSLCKINPDAVDAEINDAVRKFRRQINEKNQILSANQWFQDLLVQGISVRSKNHSGKKNQRIKIVEKSDPELNNWFVVQQFDVRKDINRRIPDLVVFLNGLPVIVFELKSLANEKVHLISAFNQLETYKRDIGSLFKTNQVLVVSNLKFARIGSISAGWARFMPWRKMNQRGEYSDEWELEVLIRDLFDKDKFIDYIHNFVLFQETRPKPVKIIAGYHQYNAVRSALQRTIDEVSKSGRGRIGVVWHTQGSGKSLTMTFLARLIGMNQRLENPTMLVLTDRNDLDSQLFQTFSAASKFLRQDPVKIDNKEQLVSELKGKMAGGIIFSTIQKFLPNKDEELGLFSERNNIIVFTDEAHRSQYDFLDGYAYHLGCAFPNASFIGFTGTPISYTDRDTRAVFGDDISVYDLIQSVEDGSTVKIYHENRKIPLKIGKQTDEIDKILDEITEGEELVITERAKRRFSRLDQLFGTRKRVTAIRDIIVPDIESRWEIDPSKKVMIVCATRRTCVRIHDLIAEVRPQWFSEDVEDDTGGVKVIMTGTASDPAELQIHVRNSSRRKALGEKFRNPDSEFKVAIVCDMWLTGFDAPSLSTMYIDKPMKGHALMQALARVNRAFKDKDGGWVVDFYGLGIRIAEAVNHYTSDGNARTVVYDLEDAERILEEKHAIVRHLFRNLPMDEYWSLDSQKRIEAIQIFVGRVNDLVEKDIEASRRKFGRHMSELNKAYSLAKVTEIAKQIRNDVKLFQTIQACVNHRAPEEHKDPELLNSAIRQVLDDSIEVGVAEIFNIETRGRSIFDEKFLEQVSNVADKNAQQGVLLDLIRGELKDMRKRFLVQSRKFSVLLQQTLERYQNSEDMDIQDALDSMFELIEQIRESQSRGAELGLSEAELAFYDALETNEASVRSMGEERLTQIAKKAAVIVHKAAQESDWLANERKQKRLHVAIIDLLDDEGYPEDKRRDATLVVLEQARLSALADHSDQQQ